MTAGAARKAATPPSTARRDGTSRFDEPVRESLLDTLDTALLPLIENTWRIEFYAPTPHLIEISVLIVITWLSSN
jgi:hypothetical protein